VNNFKVQEEMFPIVDRLFMELLSAIYVYFGQVSRCLIDSSLGDLLIDIVYRLVTLLLGQKNFVRSLI